MSSSLPPDQVAEQDLREKAEVEVRVKYLQDELEGKVKYLQDELGKLTSERSRNLRNSNSNNKHDDSSFTPSEREDEDNPFASFSDASSR